MFDAAQAEEKITYQDHVLPLIESNCGKCHNPDKKKGDLDLTSYSGALKGGGSGPVVVAGNPDSSKLWKAITHAEDPTMPPNKPKLPDKELEVFRKWIAGGLLETTGSKAIAANKPTVDLTLSAASVGKPDGPPPMPEGLSLEPVVHTPRLTALTGLASSPWAPLIAVAGEKQVLLYHADTLETLGILPFTEGFPDNVTFSRSGKLLLAGGGRGGQSGRVLVWDVVTGERVMTLGDEYDSVLAADIRPDQSQIALGGPGRLVKIYSTRTGELLHKLKKHTDWVNSLAFSPNGEMLASADRNGGISLWDPENGQELFTLAGHKASVTALSWRGDSKVLASCSEDGSVKWWETQDGKQAKSWNAHGGGALWVNFAHDGRLVSCGRDNQITLWDANGGKVRAFDFLGDLPLRVTFNHDDTRIFATDFAGRVAAWTVADGKRVGELDANPTPLAEQLVAAEKRVAELQLRGSKPSAEEQAAKALEQAKAEQTATEQEVVRLKEEAARNPPPADIQLRLAAARETRGKARAARTNATELLQARTRQADALREKLAQLKSEDPAGALAAAKALILKLKAAQAQATVFRARERLAARKREHEKLLAVAAARQEAAEQGARDFDAASDPAARSKLKTALKTATAEAKAAQSAAKKLAGEIASEQARLDKLAAEAEKVKTASAPTQQQSKL